MAGKGGKGQLAVKTTAANKDKKGLISKSSRPEVSFLWVGSSAPENEDLCEWPCWGNCCCLLGFNSGVPDCRGARAGWKCKQRFEGEENDTQAFEAAIRGEEELDTLIRETIDGGGVVPHTHMSLISEKNL